MRLNQGRLIKRESEFLTARSKYVISSTHTQCVSERQRTKNEFNLNANVCGSQNPDDFWAKRKKMDIHTQSTGRHLVATQHSCINMAQTNTHPFRFSEFASSAMLHFMVGSPRNHAQLLFAHLPGMHSPYAIRHTPYPVIPAALYLCVV